LSSDCSSLLVCGIVGGGGSSFCMPTLTTIATFGRQQECTTVLAMPMMCRCSPAKS
jgi:hypothetical protein